MQHAVFTAVTALVAAGLTVLGVWVAVGLLTDKAALAMTLTGAWFVLAGAVALALAVRWRRLGRVALGSWLCTSLVVGGVLLVTSRVERTVDEDVVRVTAPQATGAATPTETAVAAPPPELAASGSFRSGAHKTRGLASLISLASGRRVLTLTRFATSPGPDLRLYLVPPGGDIEDATDLGGLKGNKGDQQYDVPRSTRASTVVVWCQAFSVQFGSARLSPV